MFDHESTRRMTLAWPLALIFVVLVVYASLYPFEGWRDQGVAPWAYLFAPWPQYWSGFDVGANFFGYIPLGLLLTLAMSRSGHSRGAWWLGVFGPMVLSFVLEAVQSRLPQRVPSQVDWLLNSAGALAGTGMALVLWRVGWLDPWNRWRADWLSGTPVSGVVLLVLWPFAVLYPLPLPYGLGQVWGRAEAALGGLLEGTPFLGWVPEMASTPPLSPLSEASVVALFAWAPCLLGFALFRSLGRRLGFLPLWAATVLGAGGLSAALTYGPAHAWAWMTPPALLGLVTAAVLGMVSLPLGRRSCALLLMLALTYALGVLNRAPESPYFAQSLAVWEQGRFIRFHGLSQWLGWLWPYAALTYGAGLALGRQGADYNQRA